MSEKNLNSLMESTIKKIHDLVQSNTVIGEQIITPDGTIIIPLSKISIGFGTAGSDFPNKNNKEIFGGGSGAGIGIEPIGFLILQGENVRLVQLASQNNSADRIVNLVPEVIDKISSMIPKKKNKEDKQHNTNKTEE